MSLRQVGREKTKVNTEAPSSQGYAKLQASRSLVQSPATKSQQSPLQQAEKANIEAVKCAQIAQQAQCKGRGNSIQHSGSLLSCHSGTDANHNVLQVSEKKEDCMRVRFSVSQM